MWWMSLALAAELDGAWRVSEQEVRSSTCAQKPQLQGTDLVLGGGALRVDSSAIPAHLDGGRLYARGPVGEQDEHDWSVTGTAARLEGEVVVWAEACSSRLAVVLTRPPPTALPPTPPPPTPPAAPPPLDGTLLFLAGPTPAFRQGTAELLPEADPFLSSLLDRLPAGAVVVAVHTDSQGSDTYNLQLTQQRADAIVAWLAAHGRAEVTGVGLGESFPVATNMTAEGRAANRRVEIRRR